MTDKNNKSENNLSAEIEKHINPDVKFSLNPEWDYLKIFAVLSGTGFQHNVPKEVVTSCYPELGKFGNIPAPELEEKVKAFVSETYKSHWSEYQAFAGKAKNDWDGYSDTFFQAANTIFKGINWLRGQYFGCLSICPPFPKNLQSKIFQVPFGDKRNSLQVTAHEMLHFLFYEYVRKRYLDNETDISEKMNQFMEGKLILPLWSISEIFNMIVLPGKEFGDGRMKENPDFPIHPELREDRKKLALIWKEVGGNIDDFFGRLEVKR